MTRKPTVYALDQAATIWLDVELGDDNQSVSLLPAPSLHRTQAAAASAAASQPVHEAPAETALRMTEICP